MQLAKRNILPMFGKGSKKMRGYFVLDCYDALRAGLAGLATAEGESGIDMAARACYSRTTRTCRAASAVDIKITIRCLIGETGRPNLGELSS